MQRMERGVIIIQGNGFPVLIEFSMVVAGLRSLICKFIIQFAGCVGTPDCCSAFQEARLLQEEVSRLKVLQTASVQEAQAEMVALRRQVSKALSTVRQPALLACYFWCWYS